MIGYALLLHWENVTGGLHRQEGPSRPLLLLLVVLLISLSRLAPLRKGSPDQARQWPNMQKPQQQIQNNTQSHKNGISSHSLVQTASKDLNRWEGGKLWACWDQKNPAHFSFQPGRYMEDVGRPSSVSRCPSLELHCVARLRCIATYVTDKPINLKTPLRKLGQGASKDKRTRQVGDHNNRTDEG